jgi:hypothetical protein
MRYWLMQAGPQGAPIRIHVQQHVTQAMLRVMMVYLQSLALQTGVHGRAMPQWLDPAFQVSMRR